jgi:hypothetical protein
LSRHAQSQQEDKIFQLICALSEVALGKPVAMQHIDGKMQLSIQGQAVDSKELLASLKVPYMQAIRNLLTPPVGDRASIDALHEGHCSLRGALRPLRDWYQDVFKEHEKWRWDLPWYTMLQDTVGAWATRQQSQDHRIGQLAGVRDTADYTFVPQDNTESTKQDTKRPDRQDSGNAAQDETISEAGFGTENNDGDLSDITRGIEKPKSHAQVLHIRDQVAQLYEQCVEGLKKLLEDHDSFGGFEEACLTCDTILLDLETWVWAARRFTEVDRRRLQRLDAGIVMFAALVKDPKDPRTTV